jgi:hypothetical protein
VRATTPRSSADAPTRRHRGEREPGDPGRRRRRRRVSNWARSTTYRFTPRSGSASSTTRRTVRARYRLSRRVPSPAPANSDSTSSTTAASRTASRWTARTAGSSSPSRSATSASRAPASTRSPFVELGTGLTPWLEREAEAPFRRRRLSHAADGRRPRRGRRQRRSPTGYAAMASASGGLHEIDPPLRSVKPTTRRGHAPAPTTPFARGSRVWLLSRSRWRLRPC